MQSKQSNAEPTQSDKYFLDRAASRVKGAVSRAWSAVSERLPAGAPLHPSVNADKIGAAERQPSAKEIRNEPIASSQQAASNDIAAPLPASRN